MLIDRPRERRLRVAALTALLAGIVALCVPEHRSVRTPSWESLLDPYSRGAPLPGGFRIEAIRRGAGNDVVVEVRRPGDPNGVEVHVLRRGAWPGVSETKSFSIGYETPHSPAPQREAITALLADSIRSRDRGLPSPDVIPLGVASDPSALPWWLDVLRGWRGTLLGASLVALAFVLFLPSAVACGAAIALAAAAVLARAAGLPSAYPELGGGWMVVAAFALLAVALARRHAVARSDLLAALAVTAVALSLRFALGPWSPLHVNGYGPNFIFAAAREPSAAASYGPGYVEIFGWIAALAPSNPDWAIFACNALLSGLVPALAFAIGRLTGLSSRAAAAAALLVAIDPIAIRMSATETYFTPILFLCSAAGAALLAAAAEIDAGRHRQETACLAAAGLLLAEAVRIHPSAWVAASAVPFVVLAATIDLRRRVLVFTAAVLMIGGLLIAASGEVLLEVLARMRSGTMYRPATPASLRPLGSVAAAAAVCALLAPRRWLAVPAAVSLAALVMTRDVFWESWIWRQSSWRLHSTLPVIALAGALSPLLMRRSVAVAAALLVAAGWFRFALPIAVARTTDQDEYVWVRRQLVEIPPACRVVHVASAGKRHLVLPTYVRQAPAAAIVESEPQTADAALAPAACIYYVHTSLCSSAEGRPLCEAIESRLALVPIARASFPARPSRDRIPYDTDPIETVVARVDEVSGAPASAP